MTGLPYNHTDFDLPDDRILHTSTPHHWKEGAVVDSIVFCPPISITAEELDEMFAPIEAALDATMARGKSERLM